MSRRNSSGFALLLVLWTIVLLSGIALTLASTVRTETQSAQNLWTALQAERLAKSGHEFAAYLDTRRIGTDAEDLSGLPVQPLVAGLKYSVQLGTGSIELLLEGDNGRLDLNSLDQQSSRSFFTTWTGDVNRGVQVSDSLLDWIDPDDALHAMGAEFPNYLARGYVPRNGRLGPADLFLLNGLNREDLFSSLTESSEGIAIRNPLPTYVAATRTGNAVNPNYASRTVLQSLPGMTAALLDVIVTARSTSAFKNQEDFRQRTGLAADSEILARFVFDRGGAPAVMAIARLQNSSTVRTERRTRNLIRPRNWRAEMPLLRALWLVERDLPMRPD